MQLECKLILKFRLHIYIKFMLGIKYLSIRVAIHCLEFQNFSNSTKTSNPCSFSAIVNIASITTQQIKKKNKCIKFQFLFLISLDVQFLLTSEIFESQQFENSKNLFVGSTPSIFIDSKFVYPKYNLDIIIIIFTCKCSHNKTCKYSNIDFRLFLLDIKIVLTHLIVKNLVYSLVIVVVVLVLDKYFL